MRSALRIVAAVGAMCLATSAYAGVTPVPVILNGTSTGSFTFAAPGTEDFTFTIPANFHYDFTITEGAFSFNHTGGAGPESFGVTASAPGTIDFSLTTSAVPESVTWAMMLLGFASLGIVGYGRRSFSGHDRGASGDVGVA